MHITNSTIRKSSIKLATCGVVGLLTVSSQFAGAAAYLWDGGGSDGKISTPANWNPDGAPTATGHTLTFAGTTNLSVNNDVITALATSGTSITFNSGAGSFNIGGNTMTLGSGGGGGLTIVQQNSASDQTISANINLSGGNGDRSIVFGSGAGGLILSGNINFSNDWLFPTTTAGTITLSGTNTGDGKGTAAITAGTNSMRAMMRNNIGATTVILGSDSALGNTGTGDASLGTASFRGIIANQQLNLGANASRNLSGSTLAINASNITYNSTSSLTVGNIISLGGNRDFVVSNSGQVTVGNIFMSADATGRSLFANMSGAGGMVVSGKLVDTFLSTGLTTGTSTFRKAGTGAIALNGDSSSYNGSITLEAGTLQLGHSNALGNTTGQTTFTSGATLDLNGQTIGETINTISGTGVGGIGALINSNTTTGASLSTDIVNPLNFTVGGNGNITVPRIRSSGVFTITKIDNGSLTTNGTSHNNLAAWAVNSGTVVLANTSGLGADRGVTIAGGTLKLSGANSDLVNDGQSFTINSGTFDLNGKAEAVAAVAGSGGFITNTNATTGTLFVGGGSSGTSSASYGGAIQNGTGVLNVTKEGTGTQTLTSASIYTGVTTVNNGKLVVDGSIVSNTTIANSAILGGSGTISGTVTLNDTAILAPGNSAGTLTISNALTLTANSNLQYELLGTATTVGSGINDLTTGVTNLTIDGTLNVTETTAGSFLSATTGNTWRLINYTGSLTDNGLLLGTTPTLSSGLSFALDTATAGQVNLTVVPEPTTLAIIGIGFGAMLRRRREYL